MYQYLAKTYAFFVAFDDPLAETFPAPLLLEVLRNCAPLKWKSQYEQMRELRDWCGFHEHGDGERKKCELRQVEDGASYGSFLGACMQRVYAYDEAVKAQDEGVKAEEAEAV